MHLQKSSLFLFFLILSTLSADYVTLGDSKLTLKINTDTKSKAFGAVVGISRDNEKTWDETNLFQLAAASALSPKKATVLSATDTLVTLKVDKYVGYDLSFTVYYRYKESKIIVQTEVEANASVKFMHGLKLKMHNPYAYVTSHAIGMKRETFNINTIDEVIRNCEQVTTFFSGDKNLTFFVQNPFQSSWTINNDGIIGAHSFNLLNIFKPLERIVEGYPFQPSPDIYSQLNNGEKMSRTIEIYCDEPSIQTPIAFSEHPDGYSQSVTMYWDELPNRDNWKFMTTEDNKEVKHDHFWIRFLNENKKRKMGYLLLVDRILKREKSKFEHWVIEDTWVIPDSLDEHSGAWCASLIADKDTTIRFYQDISCTPNTTYTLAYYSRCQDVNGSGLYGEIYGYPDGKLRGKGEAYTGTSDWRKEKVTFTTNENDTQLRIFLRLQDAKGIGFFDDVTLYKNDAPEKNLLRNSSFEENTPFLTYDNPRRHFTDAHGKTHLKTKAPQSYLDFLKRIEDNTLLYGWEDRVHLGSHGYHHTPSLMQPDIPSPGWEFQHYDPYGDSLRFARIMEESYAIGLTNKSLKYFRSAGIMYTASMIDELLRHDFEFVDWDRQEHYTTGFIQKDGKRLWGTDLCWWADVSLDDDLVKMTNYLERGHFAQTGGHPGPVFAQAKEESYERFNTIYTNFETKFPNMGYLFPDEFARNADAIYEIGQFDLTQNGSETTITFSGAVPKGVSLVLRGICSDALLNGETVETKKVDSLTYIILPETTDGTHTITLKEVAFYKLPVSLFQTSKVITQFAPSVVAQSGRFVINFDKPYDAFTFELFTLAGRKVFSKGGINAGKQIELTNKMLARGPYIYKLTLDKKAYIEKIVF